MRKFSRAECHQVAKRYKAIYWSIDPEKFFSFVCSVRARRKGERLKLHITADFAPALDACGIPSYQERGYVEAAADRDIFNLTGTLVKNGKSWGILERRKKHEPKLL